MTDDPRKFTDAEIEEWRDRVSHFFAALACRSVPREELQDAWTRLRDMATDPTRSFHMLWSLTKVAAAAQHTASGCTCHQQHGHDHHVGLNFAKLDDTGVTRLEADDVPPAYRLLGRFITAAYNDDDDAALALWNSIPADDEVCDHFLGSILGHFVPTAARALHQYAIATGSVECPEVNP